MTNKKKSIIDIFFYIFDYLKKIEIMPNKKESIVKVTKEGRLYIETSDFFKQDKIQKTVADLLKSDIVKEIENRKKLKFFLSKKNGSSKND